MKKIGVRMKLLSKLAYLKKQDQMGPLKKNLMILFQLLENTTGLISIGLESLNTSIELN